MRLLMLHVDRFASRVTERGRSPLVEPAEPPETAVGEALVVLAAAVEILARAAEHLAHRGLAVHRTPFGWFNTLELSAKGHPLSRVARAVRPGEPRRPS